MKSTQSILKKNKNSKCYWCGCGLNVRNATKDHIIPRCYGGLNLPYNQVLCCAECNVSRSQITSVYCNARDGYFYVQDAVLNRVFNLSKKWAKLEANKLGKSISDKVFDDFITAFAKNLLGVI